MPALSFLAFVGLALIALLFYGNGTTHYAVAPPPNMTSQEVSQPKSPPDALAKIGHVARAARAEAPNRRVTHTNYQQTPFFDRFSIKGY
jgi:hypothetical protein